MANTARLDRHRNSSHDWEEKGGKNGPMIDCGMMARISQKSEMGLLKKREGSGRENRELLTLCAE